MSTENGKPSTPVHASCYAASRRIIYSEMLADTCQHYRLPDWPSGRTVVSIGDGLRLYWHGKYCGYIGSLNMEDQKRTSFQKVAV
jgi:hypothetical protein